MSKDITCPQLQSDLAQLKSLQQEFNLALDKGREAGDLKLAQTLKAQIEQKMASLKEKLWPFQELPKPELEKQYQSQKEIFQKTGILERLSTGELGIKGIDNQEYPFPEIQDIFAMMKENKEILKTKSEQGFQKLLITPFGMKLNDLIDRYRQALWKHYTEKKLFATMKNSQDQTQFPDDLPFDKETIEKIKSGEIKYEDVWNKQGNVYGDKNSGLWAWDQYKDADISGELVYNPKELPTTGEEPDKEKRRQKSQGKTKAEVLAQEGAGWDIQLIEDLPNIPRKDQGKTTGNRLQLDTAGTSILKYIQEGKDTPSPQEYLKAIQNDPIYQYEQGMTPEDQITYAIFHLEQTNQAIDDYQGNGSMSYQLGAYFLSGDVP
ncbi:MAG: hypothetical protein AAB906_00955, partial [Patescibacteria group bacterium]